MYMYLISFEFGLSIYMSVAKLKVTPQFCDVCTQYIYSWFLGTITFLISGYYNWK